MKSLFLAATSALAITLTCPGAETADLIFLNGRYITLDAREQIAEAMAIKDGRILAVGGNEEIKKLAGPGTKAEDLAGRTVLPGLIESHCHSIGAARQHGGCSVLEGRAMPDEAGRDGRGPCARRGRARFAGQRLLLEDRRAPGEQPPGLRQPPPL